jgi:hypothetical protein
MHLLWRFEICLPSLYILTEFSPNDQNTLKRFVSIKRTNIYISSYKFVLIWSILIEFRFDTWQGPVLGKNFHDIFDRTRNTSRQGKFFWNY